MNDEASRRAEPGLSRELERLRRQLRRNRAYLGASLAVLGVVTFAALGLFAFYGFRLAASLAETEGALRSHREATDRRAEEIERGLARQREELDAIRRAANEEIQAMREAHRKLAAARDSTTELSALREANEALWTELSNQRAELLEALREREDTNVDSRGAAPRFRLGETSYEDPRESGAVPGFIPGGEKIHRATSSPGNPASLLIELSPEGVGLGEPYELAVRLVNRSNGPIQPVALRLDWSFQGKNTGGDVPLGARRVDAQKTALLYSLSGQWTEAHRNGPASVTATVTVSGGARLSNTLSW